MKTVQFTGPELELLREALTEYRNAFSPERRREDVQILTAVDNLLDKLLSHPGEEPPLEGA